MRKRILAIMLLIGVLLTTACSSVQNQGGTNTVPVTSEEEQTVTPQSITSKEEQPVTPQSITSKEEQPIPPQSVTSEEEQTVTPQSITSKEEQPVTPQSVTSKEEQPAPPPSEEVLGTEQKDMENNMKIDIRIGDKSFAATLVDNKTANAFVDMLPITIEMEDVNGNEKYYVLPAAIGNEVAVNPGSIQAGNMMCYGDAGLVLFYESFSTSYPYIPIGQIDNIDGLTKELGSGNVQITFSEATKNNGN